MKLSTITSPKVRDPLSICLIGAPGAGKTVLGMSFPSVYILDCDENLDGPELFHRGKNKNLSYAYDSIRTDDKGKPVDIWNCFDRLMDKLALVKSEESIKTVVIDSLTHVNEFIIQKVLKSQGRSVMEARDWQPFKSHAISLLVGRLRSLGKTTIAICHEVEKTRPDPKLVMQEHVEAYKPNFQGGVGDTLGGFFTDVWRCSASPGVAGKLDYLLQTTRTTKSIELKNSLGMPSEFKCSTGDLMFDKIKPYLEGRI